MSKTIVLNEFWYAELCKDSDFHPQAWVLDEDYIEITGCRYGKGIPIKIKIRLDDLIRIYNAVKSKATTRVKIAQEVLDKFK